MQYFYNQYLIQKTTNAFIDNIVYLYRKHEIKMSIFIHTQFHMQKGFIVILLILFSIIPGCKKDNNRIASPIYQLDSVVESRLDTSGNAVYGRTIPIVQNYVENSIPEINTLDFSSNITYYENNDSIILKLFVDTYTIRDYLYIIDGKFNFINNTYYEYANHDYQIKRQYISYNSDDKIHSIASTDIYYPSWFSGNNFDVEWPDSTQCYARNKKEIVFSYDENNLNALNYDYYNGFSDTPLFSVHNRLFSYNNHYKNQKGLIGIDVNDIILSSFLFQWYNVNRGFASPTLQLHFYALQLSLILNKQAGFNTDCDDLIEHIQYNNISTGIGSPYILGETDIRYEFDPDFNNRIRSMTIDNYMKYNFYYKD